MSASLPNGAVLSIATTYGAAIPVTVLTNAAPPVATATAHGLTNLDILEVTSGWLGLDQRPARVAGSTTNNFNLEGHDTTSTTQFPAGTGIGSVRKVLTWTQISQVMDPATSGGDQRFVNWNYLEDGNAPERAKPTNKAAKVLILKLADDPAQAWNAVLKAADAAGTPRIIRLALPNGSFIYYNSYVGFDDEPSLGFNNIMQVSLTLTSAARFVRYAS
ncbi:phage tail protein [Variovorax ginsengisoli]|uniref:Phage tail protein n=1 Tax=Variovorax ginsengisoli TaxID=363844 RepID=A0ABT8SDQ4_9BURK|nr:phage tail protein [Variovorax ginsengisoli]MDN8617873.1 phage tail protein [Variovorax ginsengisoli]MDO1537043.1 phage tail protein [Variovorax ginsengisoli]